MLKQALFLLISASWCTASPADSRISPMKCAVTVKETPRGYTISVDASSAPLDTLLQELGNQCRVRIAWWDGRPLLQRVSMHFCDLTLESALKKLIRAGGIHNYLFRYSQGDSGRHSITEVVIFGNSTMAKTAFSHSRPLADEKQHELGSDLNPPTAPDDDHSKKLASLIDRYCWENEETRAWAVHLLEAMPDEVQDFGLDVLMKELDKAREPGRTAVVNSDLFYRAIEASAPPGVAPVMMRQVRKLSEHYHNRTAGGKADASRDGF